MTRMLNPRFVQQVGSEQFVFFLAGRAWLVKHLDIENGEMIVAPAPKGALPRWGGGGPLLSREVAEAIRAVLISEETCPFLTNRAHN